MSDLIWNHGNISKVEALRRFRKFHPDGSFLVRKSESLPNAFALSVGYQNNVYHYRIFQDQCQRFLFENKVFSTLSEIVSYYHVHKGSLVCLLKHPVHPPLNLPTDQGAVYDCPVYVKKTDGAVNDQGYEKPTW